MRQKGFSVILILFLIVILAIGLLINGYFVYIKLFKWETYTNNDYGFSLQYPHGWIVQEIKDNPDQYQIYIEHPSDIKGEFPEIYVYVWSYSTTANQDTKPNISIAGIPAVRKSLSDNTVAAHDLVTFQRDDYLFDISLVYKDGKTHEPQNKYDKEALGIFDKMLTTFKFIDGKSNIGSACVNNQAEIFSLISKFENLQREKNTSEVLGLFTPPQDGNDIETELFFSGKKTGVPGLYRNVTTNFNLIDYKIISGPNPIENMTNTCVVNVEEQISSYSNTPPIGYQDPITSKVSFEVTRQGTLWKIDRYYLTGKTAGKYSAWGY